MQYLVAGPSIINDISCANGSKHEGLMGGSIFCVAGIRLWTDSVLYISNVGLDYIDYYGNWMDANKLSYEGLSFSLPHTWHTHLFYEKDDLHNETSIYGEADEKNLEQLDTISASQIARHCDADTKGIYIESTEQSIFWKNISNLREKTNAKIMWEIPTSATLDFNRHKGIFETIALTDYFSLNRPEAEALFDVTGEDACLNVIKEMGKTCFFRVGEQGSYIIHEGSANFAPSLTVGTVIDTTGCGNASTAAALFGICEGLEPKKVAQLANISAAYNLLQFGPYPKIDDQLMESVKKLLA